MGELSVGPFSRRRLSVASSVAAGVAHHRRSSASGSILGGVSTSGRRERRNLADSNASVRNRRHNGVCAGLDVALRSLMSRLDTSGTSAVVAVHASVAKFRKGGGGNDRLGRRTSMSLSELGLVDSFGLRRRAGRRGGGGSRDIVSGTRGHVSRSGLGDVHVGRRGRADAHGDLLGDFWG